MAGSQESRPSLYMSISIKSLYEGKESAIGTEGTPSYKEFYGAQKYCEPFIKRMQDINAELVIDAIESNQSINGFRTFEKVSILGVMGDFIGDTNYKPAIGLCYDIKNRKPNYKFFKAYYNPDTGVYMACKDNKVSNAIENDTIFDYAPVKSLIELTDEFNTMHAALDAKVHDRDDRHKLLGEWIEKASYYQEQNEYGKVKIAVNDVIKAYKSLYMDEDSPYYIDETNNASALDILEAFVQVINDDKKDITNKYEKTLIAQRIIR